MTILTLLQEVDKVKYCKADLHRGTFVLVQLIITAIIWALRYDTNSLS